MSFNLDNLNCSSKRFDQTDRYLPYASNNLSIRNFLISKPNPNDGEYKHLLYNTLITDTSCKILSQYRKYYAKYFLQKNVKEISFYQENKISINDGISDYYSQPITLFDKTLAYAAADSTFFIPDISLNPVKIKLVSKQTGYVIESIQLISSKHLLSVKMNDKRYHEITLTDITTQKKWILMDLSFRIASISSNPMDNNIFATGDQHGIMKIFDLRQDDLIDENRVAEDQYEICSLKFSPDGTYIAEGRNSNRVYLWDLRKNDVPIFKLKNHKASVKGIDWVNKDYFITGGGIKCQRIFVWFKDSSQPINSKNLGAQITGIRVISDNIFISLGFSLNCIKILKFDHKKITQPIQDQNTLCADSNMSARFLGLEVYHNQGVSTISGYTENNPTEKIPSSLRLWQEKSIDYYNIPPFPTIR